MKILKNTRLYLSPRGEICTTQTNDRKDQSLAAFSVEALEMDIVVSAEYGGTKTVLEPQPDGRVKRTILKCVDEDEPTTKGKPAKKQIQRLAQTLTIAALLAESGLTLDDEPYTEYVLRTGNPPEHLPNAGAPTVVRPNTTLYLSPMGTIGLSAATEHGKEKPFTVLDLRNGRTVTTVDGPLGSDDWRLAASIVPEGGGTVRWTSACNAPKSHELAITSIHYLLEMNGLVLQD